MDDSKRALAERAAKARGFRWMAGMRDVDGAVCVKASSDLDCKWTVDDWLSDWCELAGDEALGDPGAYVECHSDSKVWQVWVATEVGHPLAMGVGAFSEAEALVIALEKAPAKESPDA